MWNLQPEGKSTGEGKSPFNNAFLEVLSIFGITRHLKLKCLTLKIKNFKFASNLRENF